MTEPTQAVKEMDFTYSVDQQVSVNAFIEIDVNGEPVRFQITNRYNSSPDKIAKTTKAAIEAFMQLRSEYPRPAQSSPAPVKQESKSEHKDEHAGTYEDPRSFKASAVVVSMTDGKQYFKVKAEDGKFPKFPVTVWPETLEKAGIDPNKIDMKDGHKLDCLAYYIINDKGNPAKIISFGEPNPF